MLLKCVANRTEWFFFNTGIDHLLLRRRTLINFAAWKGTSLVNLESWAQDDRWDGDGTTSWSHQYRDGLSRRQLLSPLWGAYYLPLHPKFLEMRVSEMTEKLLEKMEIVRKDKSVDVNVKYSLICRPIKRKRISRTAAEFVKTGGHRGKVFALKKRAIRRPEWLRTFGLHAVSYL